MLQLRYREPLAQLSLYNLKKKGKANTLLGKLLR
jgi:hypothetical protein